MQFFFNDLLLRKNLKGIPVELELPDTKFYLEPIRKELAFDRPWKKESFFVDKSNFLQCSVDAAVKGNPTVVFSLETLGSTSIFVSSCFLFSELGSRYFQEGALAEPSAFFFNWFDHNKLLFDRPSNLNSITDEYYYSFYYSVYRIFDYSDFELSENERNLSSLFFKNFFFGRAFKRRLKRIERYYRYPFWSNRLKRWI